MTNNADAQIAREWASKALDNVFLNEVPIEGYRAAARHILATTTPPTMADVEWDDAVHAGLCAEHEEHGLVRMLYADGGEIDCILPGMSLLMISAEELTPIPGTRLDLTPRRPEDVPDDSPLIPEDDWRYASDATVALWHRLVPESTPEHPTVLTTEAEYLNAPAGTIVEGALTWAKGKHGCWETFGVGGGCSNSAMAGEARPVLRWGWDA